MTQLQRATSDVGVPPQLTQRWKALLSVRGRRYENCRLANYETSSESQERFVQAMTKYAQSIRDRIEQGQNVLLYGPAGTGKDHVMMALARVAIFRGRTVSWRNGQDMFGDFRDAMGSSYDCERALVQRLVEPDVFYLSDPVPPFGSLTEFQMSVLFRIIDRRYSRKKPTWVTINVASREELDERIGPQTADRLIDGSVAHFCSWPSFRRKAPQPTFSKPTQKEIAL